MRRKLYAALQSMSIDVTILVHWDSHHGGYFILIKFNLDLQLFDRMVYFQYE